MERKEIKDILKNFLSIVSMSKLSKDFWKSKKKIINELSKKLLKKKLTAENIEEYLNYVIKEMDELNVYFKKNGRSPISYSNILNFANKYERLSSFLLGEGIKKKITKEKPARELAGFDLPVEEIDPLKEFRKLSFSHKGESYGFIYKGEEGIYFFSTETRKILVQDFRGKIFSYNEFKKYKKGVKLPTTLEIYRTIKKFSSKSVAMTSFLIYVRQEKAKLRRKKWNLKKEQEEK